MINRPMSQKTLRRIRELKQEFLDSFADRLPAFQSLRANATRQQPEREQLSQLRSEIHQLRGSAGLYQLTELQHLADSLQQSLDHKLEQSSLGPMNPAELHLLDRLMEILQDPSELD